MWYLMHENDQKHRFKEGYGRFVRVIDDTTKKETLRVTFTPNGNGCVYMETKYPLTFIYDGKTWSTKEGGYYSYPLNHEVVLLSDSVETPRITVRVVQLDDPKDWPTPPPEDRVRAPTLVYVAVGDPAPPPSPTPPPVQEQKKKKKRRREFHMCAW